VRRPHSKEWYLQNNKPSNYSNRIHSRSNL